jgi:hypothetical protein
MGTDDGISIVQWWMMPFDFYLKVITIKVDEILKW